MSTLEVKAIQAPTGYDLQMPTGHIVQVVHSSTTTSASSSSTSHADTGLTATITPKFSSSKILVAIHQNGVRKHNDHAYNDVDIFLLRGSTNIANIGKYVAFTNSAMHLYVGTVSGEMLDSPATTSATTYKTTFANPDGGSNGTVYVQEANARSTITLMEVAQ